MLGLEYNVTLALPAENYQNKVLRPILKFQNDLIMNVFLDYCKRMKITLGDSSTPQFEFIKKILSQQQSIRIQLIGMVTGLLSLEEHEYYLSNQKELNKRIVSMLVERIHSQL